MRLLQLGQQTRLVPHGATSYIASADSHAWLATFGSAILLLNTQHWIECLRILRPVIFVELPKSLKSWDGKSPLVHPPGMRPWGEADGILVHLRPWPVLCLPSLSWRTCRCHRTLARKPGDCAKGDSKPGEPRDREPKPAEKPDAAEHTKDTEGTETKLSLKSLKIAPSTENEDKWEGASVSGSNMLYCILLQFEDSCPLSLILPTSSDFLIFLIILPTSFFILYSSPLSLYRWAMQPF